MLEYLKTIPIKEIAAKTHLDEARIKAILNKDFKNLNGVNVAMNLKILEREYKVDFSEWLNEFNEYKKENYIDTKQSLKVKPKVMGYNSGIESNSNLSYFIYLIIAVVAIVLAAFYYFNYYENSDEQTVPSSVVDEIEIQKNSNPEIEQENNTVQIVAKPDIKNLEEKVEIINEEPMVEEQIPQSKESIPEQKESQVLEEAAKEPEIIQAKLILTPSSKSWVSVKNLITKESKNYMVTKSVSFNQDSLIFVGNNLFTLELDHENIELPKTMDARYILFKDGKISFISKQEYSKLDKAK